MGGVVVVQLEPSLSIGMTELPFLPVWIVHVFLSNFVRLGVHVDRVFRLGAHVVLPDDAALLGYLKVRRLARVDWNKFAKSLIL